MDLTTQRSPTNRIRRVRSESRRESMPASTLSAYAEAMIYQKVLSFFELGKCFENTLRATFHVAQV